MGKLTKAQTKEHKEIDSLLLKESLSYEEKEMILNKFYPSSITNVTDIAAFFTPLDLAWDFRLEVPEGARVLDLCAGIGCLSFPIANRHYSSQQNEIVCVELMTSFYNIGKKIVPEATWYNHTALDLAFLKTLGKFDFVISNPPFGKIKTNQEENGLRYTGADFEYKIIDIAHQLCPDGGAFIIPTGSAPFKYSGAQYYQRSESAKYLKFEKETGCKLDAGVGIDCSLYREDWKHASPACEIVTIIIDN